MGEKEWGPADVFDVFGDPIARRILVLASSRPVSADDLANQLDVSRPTIYRRVNALVDYDLLSERQQIDIKGNHFQVFETTFRRITLEIDGVGYNIDLQMRQSLADQFESFWSELEGAQSDRPGGRTDHPDSELTES